ncbi:YihY/virulence factor BrkB family protein [Paracoccus endophyticus]|uniref:YihY/virulence factor BrkB family protein n=1 Tax=Paracoccus endophyticus TaxID=2233774 RepID=UPI000DDAD2A6|nr:YihY/virulence factor BrkB family protein [Paracoccus endophyticus]
MAPRSKAPLPEPDVYDALFGPLPEGWRERKGLPPEGTAPGKAAANAAPRGTGTAAGRAAPDTGDKAAGQSAARDRGPAAEQAAQDRAPPPPETMPGPDSPWELGRASWMAVAKRTVAEFTRDRVTSVAGGVTFFGLLALFPAITALVSIYGLVADPATITDNIDMLRRFLPPSAVDLIATQITSITSSPATSLSLAGLISILLAIWSANGGMKALIEALNVAWFETEKRGFIKLNLVSLAFTMGAILMIMVLISAIALVPAILQTVAAGSVVENLIAILRWPLVLGLLLVALAVVYRFGPSKEDAEWHWISPGALIAAVGLIVASMLFSWYAANFADYNKTYGSLGAVVGLMMWLWIACIVVMLGAEINSEVERQIKIENGVDPDDKTDRT